VIAYWLAAALKQQDRIIATLTREMESMGVRA
jgi:hypothetical protein